MREEDEEETEAYVVAEQEGEEDDESKNTEVSAAIVDVQADESDQASGVGEEESSIANSRDNQDDVEDLDEEEEEEEISVKSEPTVEEDVGSTESRLKVSSLATPGTGSGKRGGRKGGTPSSARKGRAPAVQGLTIPFRTVKKAMKLDPDIPIVQNEAAIMATLAAELFLKRLARQSHNNAKSRGRNTIRYGLSCGVKFAIIDLLSDTPGFLCIILTILRYEDVAEARTKDPSLAFLEMLLP
jgi:histone H3/H4